MPAFDKDGLIKYGRQDYDSVTQDAWDTAIHLLLQEQSALAKNISAKGSYELIYMAIVKCDLPIEDFTWIGIPLDVLRARVELYRLTGEVTL